MKTKTIIGCVAVGALVLSAVPYRFVKNEEDELLEMRSLLWGWKKVPRGEGEDKDHYYFAIPASGLDAED